MGHPKSHSLDGQGHPEFGKTDRLVAMVVDDSVKYRATLRMMGESLGHDIIEVESPLQALDRMWLNEPQLIVLDSNVRGVMDGYELCRRIRRTPGGRDSYIVIMTTHHRTDEINRAINAGADDFIALPSDGTIPLHRVTNICHQAKKHYKQLLGLHKLEDEVSRLEQQVASSSEGHFRFGLDGQLTNVNQRFASMLGYKSPREATQKIANIDGTDKSQTGGRMTGGVRRSISTILARIGVSD